jgi:hypothetical protein
MKIFIGISNSDDLLSFESFDNMLLQSQITLLFPGSQVLNRTTGSLCVNVDGIKIDHLFHPYPLFDNRIAWLPRSVAVNGQVVVAQGFEAFRRAHFP